MVAGNGELVHGVAGEVGVWFDENRFPPEGWPQTMTEKMISFTLPVTTLRIGQLFLFENFIFSKNYPIFSKHFQQTGHKNKRTHTKKTHPPKKKKKEKER